MSQFEIIVRKGGQLVARRVLPPGHYTVGRSAECDIRIDCPDVSHMHARLVVTEDDVQFEDLGSSNGSFIESTPIQVLRSLRPPQAVRLGTASLEIGFAGKIGSPAQPASTLPEAVSRSEALRTARNYQMGELVAHGGMGAVMVAKDLNLRRTVAMKRMLTGRTPSEESRQRFIREAEVLGMLEHPNIVPIHELGIDAQGEPFYTMKFVKGATLQRILVQIQEGHSEIIARYPLPQLLTILLKVCDAMSFAHSKGVVHRDLKPENIMLGDFGEVLVMDWGLAKFIEPTASPSSFLIDSKGFENQDQEEARPELEPGAIHTLEGRIMGTPNFMSPEQAEGRVDDIGPRSDVFALGGILYNVLTLCPPVNGTTMEEILEKIRSGTIRPPTTFNQRQADRRKPSVANRPDSGNSRVATSHELNAAPLPHCPGGRVPAALSAVTMKALAIEPENRYQTVGDFQKDIGAFQSGFATSAEQAGTWTLLKLAVRRHRTEFTIAACALTVVATLTIASLVKISGTLTELRQSAPTHYEKAQSLITEQRFHEALEKADYLTTLVPNDAQYHFLRGGLLQTLLRLRDARDAFATALRHDPKHARARQNLDLCDRLLAGSRESSTLSSGALDQLYQSLQEQGRAVEAISLFSKLGSERTRSLDEWKSRLAQAGIMGTLTRNDDDTLSLDLAGVPMTNVVALKGMPLSFLNLHGSTNLTDISPLAGMKLVFLSIEESQVTDLRPLKGMPLKEIRFGNSPVTDLSPLEGLRLSRISFYTTIVTDFSPLHGMQLISFDIVIDDRVSNLEVLRGMPIEWLRLNYCPRLRKLDFLTGMELKHVTIGTPVISDFSMLSGMPIEGADLGRSAVTNLAFLKGAPIASLSLAETPVADLTVLRDLPLTNLSLNACRQLKDISPLKGLPLISLMLGLTQVKDISALGGMPLEVLHLNNTPVKDLTPLRGAPLKTLYLSECPALTDLTPLKGLGIRELTLFNSMNVRDVSALAECRELERLILPINARNVDALRALTNLSLISYDGGDLFLHAVPPEKSPTAFWRAYDARRR